MQKLLLSLLLTVGTSIFSFIQEDSTHFEYCIHTTLVPQRYMLS